MPVGSPTTLPRLLLYKSNSEQNQVDRKVRIEIVRDFKVQRSGLYTVMIRGTR
jgi:hypothetical protein